MIDRRNFIRGLLSATAGFTILPGAGRIWKAVIDQRPLLGKSRNPDMLFLDRDFAGRWTFVMEDMGGMLFSPGSVPHLRIVAKAMEAPVEIQGGLMP